MHILVCVYIYITIYIYIYIHNKEYLGWKLSHSYCAELYIILDYSVLEYIIL